MSGEDAHYLLGHTDRELRRLDLQGELYRTTTIRAFRDAGIGEGMRVRVQTELKGADSPRNVQQALLNLFPDISADEHPNEPEFGNAIDVVWSRTRALFCD